MPDGAASSPPAHRDRSVSAETLRVVLPYLLVAGAWIVFSDRLVGQLVRDAETMAAWSTLKGLIFVAVTSALLWAAVNRRISRIKQAQEEAAAERTRLRTVLNTIPDLVWLKDREGRYLACNHAFERLTGHTEAEILGKDDFAFFDRRLAESFRRQDDHAAQAGRPVVNSERVTYPDGSVHDLETIRTPMEDGGGQSGVLGIARDVTETVRISEALTRFVSGSPAVIYALRVEGDRLPLVWTSANLVRLTGWSNEEAGGDAWWHDNLHPDDRERVVAAHATPYTSEHLILEFRFRRKDGEYVWVRDEKRLLRDAQGRPTEVIGSWSDVTARVQLEEQLRQALKLEAIGRLAGGVAHDFNNILTIIAGNADLLASLLRPASAELELLGEIRDAGERAAALTRQLLAFSRSQVLTPEVLDINLAVGRMETMLRRLIGEDIVLTSRLAPAAGCVRVDPGQFEQVLMNLALNARDAMPNGGRLTIETDAVHADEAFCRHRPELAVGAYVRLAMVDNGHGMKPEVKARAFEPFFTTKPPRQGTGLGLATVFGIVSQSGGHILVSSEVGVGSRFEIYLPQVQASLVGPEDGVVAEGTSTGHETILLVEDEESVRRIARLALESRGYKVLGAADGPEAMVLMDRHRDHIAMVLTDLVMPQMSGRELAEALRARRPGLKVLFMSGYVDDALVRHGLSEAQEAFIHKPFSLSALAEKVREVLDGDRPGLQTS
jgi:PAS domain S-box-containing protein